MLKKVLRKRQARRDVIVQGTHIREDERGLLCLNDIWEAAGSPNTKRPFRWKPLEQTLSLAKALRKKLGIPEHFKNKPAQSVLYAGRGRGGLTYAHPILAAAYAGYLDAGLEVEVREVWLRYRAGDATLADDILGRASQEANEWAGVRALSRAKRRQYTDTLQAHGVEGSGYGLNTNAVYQRILGGTAKQLRAQRKLLSNDNLRDNLSTSELGFVVAAEALATERIEEEEPFGNWSCAIASARSAGFIREAIERDRADRKRRKGK